MQNHTENTINSVPSNQVDISDNEDINYQINTTESKNQNTNNANPPYQKSSASSDNVDLKGQIEKLTDEKKTLMESLRNEMICNEEQRNYIQLLKETIEGKLYKSGLAELIQSSKEYKDYNTDSLADFFVDFNRYKSESEKYKQDLILANNVINDNKVELKSIKKDIEDLAAENILLKQKIEKEKENNIEHIKERERNEKTISSLEASITSLRTQNQILKDQIQEYQNVNKNHEKQIESTFNQLDNMSNDLSKYHALENNYNKLVSDYEQIKYEMLTIQKEKASLETELSQQKNENVRLTGYIRNLQVENQNMNTSLNSLKTKFDELKAEKNAIEKINETFRFRKKELDESNDKINTLQQQNHELLALRDNNEQIVNEYIKSISTLKLENERLLYDYNKMKKEYETQKNSFTELENKNKDLTIKIREISQEHNEVLLAHHESEMEVNRNIAEKAAFDNERRYWKSKYEEDMTKKDDELKDIIKHYKELQDKLNTLTIDYDKLQKNNKELAQKINDKCHNEQLLINERDKYKATVLKMTQKIENSKDEVQNEKSNTQSLLSRNAELEKRIKELLERQKEEKEKKMNLVSELSNLQNNQKTLASGLSSTILGLVTSNSLQNPNNYSKSFSNFINKRATSLINPPEKELEEFIQIVSQEVQALNEELNRAKEEINTLNQRYHNIEEEKENHRKLKEDINSKYNNVSLEMTRLSQDNDDLLIEIGNYKEIIQQLKATLDNYNKELVTKTTMLNNITYELNVLEDKNLKTSNDKKYLETILLRVCKMFPNSNLYKIVQDILDSFVSIEEKEQLNQHLLIELKRAEDYLRLTKENALEANYLNKQLTRQLQEANMQIRSARIGGFQGLNSSGLESNSSYNKTWDNTNNSMF